MKTFLKVLTIIAAVLYPVIIFVTLRYFNASPRVLSIILISFALLYFVAHTDKAKGNKSNRIQFWGMLIPASVLGLITFFTEKAGYVKFYPVAINIFMLFNFSITLLRPPNMIFRFAKLQDKKIEESPNVNEIESYCKKVTIVWIIFFVINALLAQITALMANPIIWATYNGLISYILIGIIFLVEIIIRKFKVKT